MQMIVDREGILEVNRNVPFGFVGYAKTLDEAMERIAMDSQRRWAKFPCTYTINQTVNRDWVNIATIEIRNRAIEMSEDAIEHEEVQFP